VLRRGAARAARTNEQKIEKGATAAPFFITGEVGLALLAGLLLPAFGFLRHLSYPPLQSDLCGANARVVSVAAAWHAHPTLTFVAAWHLSLAFVKPFKLTR
jgi:hypothetical protein